jgi:hypothetical protein
MPDFSSITRSKSSHTPIDPIELFNTLRVTDWAETKREDGMVDYRREKNMCGNDGLPTPFAMSQAVDQPASPAEQVKS